MGKIVAKTWSTTITSGSAFDLTSTDFNGEQPKFFIVTAIDTRGYSQTASYNKMSYGMWCDDSPWPWALSFNFYQFGGFSASRGGPTNALSTSHGKSFYIGATTPNYSGDVTPTTNGVTVTPYNFNPYGSGDIRLIIQAYGGGGIKSTSWDALTSGASGQIGRNTTSTLSLNNPDCTPNFTLAMTAHNDSLNAIGAGIGIGFAGKHLGGNIRNYGHMMWAEDGPPYDEPGTAIMDGWIQGRTQDSGYNARDRYRVQSYSQGSVGLQTDGTTWTKQALVYMVNVELRRPEQLSLFAKNLGSGSGAFSIGGGTAVPVSAFVLTRVSETGPGTVGYASPAFGLGIFQTDGSDNGHSMSLGCQEKSVGIPTQYSLDVRAAWRTGWMVCRPLDWGASGNATTTYSTTTSFNGTTGALDVGTRAGATNRNMALAGFSLASGGATMYLGDKEVGSLMLGTKEIEGVFLGSDEI